MIRKLSADIIREIAAGEVISAPVDVLKELLENALDAGATRLEVTLDSGGIERIKVKDNGAGIPEAELPLAVEAHSTSKLESHKPMSQGISTLGFRGEGLFAVRNAAHLSLTSRPTTQLGGATLTAEGDAVSQHAHPAPSGTSIEVTNLFARLPARRRALEPPATEGKKAAMLLSRYLLHHPNLTLKLFTDDEERWTYAGGSFTEAVKFLWGPVTANRLLELNTEQTSYTLRGLLSRPELTRPRRDRLLLAVNGRPVEWTDDLLKAVMNAYRELLPSAHYPVGILNLTLPAEEVLVNTSPDKSRVRFLQREKVAAFVQEAVETSLSAHPLAPALPDLNPVQGVSAAPRHAFPELRYVGTYLELYLLAEAAGQLWVIDQHAAHERILFEELAERYRREAPVELTSPELLPLTPEDEARYFERRDELAEMGLTLEPFGSGRWRLRTVPAFLVGHSELYGSVVVDALGRGSAGEAWRNILGRLACLPAIKAGHRLANVEAQGLLEALKRCETPWACPHGRPTALVLSELELARRFGRRGVRVTEKVSAVQKA